MLEAGRWEVIKGSVSKNILKQGVGKGKSCSGGGGGGVEGEILKELILLGRTKNKTKSSTVLQLVTK